MVGAEKTMIVKIVETCNGKIAVINSATPIICDGQSTMDFVATAVYTHDCCGIVLNKEAFSEEFYFLSSGVAGEVVQKFVNFRIRLAIVGDFSGYTSKPLHDYIYECNNGGHLCFVANEDEALSRLGG
jgi:hypothetical protein